MLFVILAVMLAIFFLIKPTPNETPTLSAYIARQEGFTLKDEK